MNPESSVVLRRSAFIWIATSVLLALFFYLASNPNTELLSIALLLTGLFAVVGIGFGVWAAIRVATHKRTSLRLD